MNTHFDIEKILNKGSITNELEYERAMIADRKLRLLAKENLHFKKLRKELRDIIEQYETKEWANVDDITNEKIVESDKYEQVAELERVFINDRKKKIRKKLKELSLTQADLAFILGHKSKTYMSELINGIKPFTLRDLIIINRLLKIDMAELVPVTLSVEDQNKVKDALIKLDNPKLSFSRNDFIFA